MEKSPNDPLPGTWFGEIYWCLLKTNFITLRTHRTSTRPRLDFGYHSKFQQVMIIWYKDYQDMPKLKSHRLGPILYCKMVARSHLPACFLLLQGFRVLWGLSWVIGLFGRPGPAATLRQYCPQMTRRRGAVVQWQDRQYVGSLWGACGDKVNIPSMFYP